MKSTGFNYLNEWVDLPEGPALRKRFEHKLGEYQNRIDKYKREYNVASVGVIIDRNDNLLDAIYKHAIVKSLLIDGKVNIGALRKQLQHEFNGYILDDLFLNAINVIDDYLKSGGVHTTGASRFFNKELFESILATSARVELPDDIKIQKRIRKKYHEYLARIHEKEESYDKTLDRGADKRDRYKARIIDELLTNHYVDLQTVIQALITSEGKAFDRLEFYQASARVYELLDEDKSETDKRRLEFGV